jgi:hypothetical protein
MSHTPYDSGPPESRAAELRDLAGPTNGDRTSAHDDDAAADGPAPAHSPDAVSDPEVDQVRAEGDDVVPDEVEDPYELRSMPAQPNPSDDDPGSYLNY